MSESKHNQSSSLSPLSDSLGDIFAQSVDLWFTMQAKSLANVDALTHAWLHRRLEGVAAIHEAIEQMVACQNPAEFSRSSRTGLRACAGARPRTSPRSTTASHR